MRSVRVSVAQRVSGERPPVQAPVQPRVDVLGHARPAPASDRSRPQRDLNDLARAIIASTGPHEKPLGGDAEAFQQTAQKLLDKGRGGTVVTAMEAAEAFVIAMSKTTQVSLATRVIESLRAPPHADDLREGAGGHATPRMVAALVTAYAKLGQPDAATSAFWSAVRVMNTPLGQGDPSPANALLNAHYQDPNRAFTLYRGLFGADKPGLYSPDQVTFNTLLKSCMHAGDAARAQDVDREMTAAGLRGDETTYVQLIKTYARAGLPEAALSVRALAAQRGFGMTLGMWSAVIQACGSTGQVDRAFSVWREMEAFGVKPRLLQYHALITACASCRQPAHALMVLQMMQAANVRRTSVTYNLALQSCRPGQQRTDVPVEALVRAAEEIAAQMRRDEFARPNLRTLTTMVSIYGEARMPERAMEAWKELRTMSWSALDTPAFHAAIAACRGAPALARKAYRTYKEARGHRNFRPKENRSLFLTAIQVLREGGLLDEALDVYRDMRAHGHPPSNAVFRELLSQCAEQILEGSIAGNGAGAAGSFLDSVERVEGGSNGNRPPAPAAHADEKACTLQGGCAVDVGANPAAEIDLHGLSIVEARAAVLCVLKAVQRRHRSGEAPVPPPLIIITGAGRHSAKSKPGKRMSVMRDSIHGMLTTELGLQVSTGGGSGRANNPGRLLIDSRDLKVWLERTSAASAALTDPVQSDEM
ncbi:unnamed protein product [Pedinophyceae sp. YPF-701]|nr:unnamed protein product [Pedinophyceae sp. YPF-701]